MVEPHRPRLLPIEAYATLRPRRSVGLLLLLGAVSLAASVRMVWHVTHLPDEPPVYYWGYQIPERITLPLLIAGGLWLGGWTLLRPAGPGMKILLGVLLLFWFVLVLSELVSGYYENGVVALGGGFWVGIGSFVAVLSASVVCYWPRL